MRTLLAFLCLSCITTALVASELPKNLLRYNMGALPMTVNAQGQWVTVAPDSLDWNAPYAAMLAGDVGKTVNLSDTKTFVIDLGRVESVKSFSLFSETAQGSVTVFSSPIFEDPATGQWSELGSLTMNAGQSANLTATPADARYLKFVFTPDSQGTIGSMGAFGDITYNDVRAPDVTPVTSSVENAVSINYATPATQMVVVGSQPAQETDALMAMFDDEPSTQFNVTQPTTITLDLGTSREISSMALAGSGDTSATVKLGNSTEELSAAPSAQVGSNQPLVMDAPLQARYAQITLTPTGNGSGVNGLSIIGQINPNSLVFDRDPLQDTAAVAGGANNPPPLPPVPPVVPRGVTN